MAVLGILAAGLWGKAYFAEKRPSDVESPGVVSGQVNASRSSSEEALPELLVHPGEASGESFPVLGVIEPFDIITGQLVNGVLLSCAEGEECLSDHTQQSAMNASACGVRVAAKGYVSRVVRQPNSAEVVRVGLARTGSVSVSILPIEALPVRIQFLSGFDGGVVVSEIVAHQSELSLDIPGGDYTLLANSPGWQVGRQGFGVKSGDRRSLRVEMRKGAELCGRVRWERTGAPIVDARVSYRSSSSGSQSSTISSHDGYFQLVGLDSGRAILSVHIDGFGLCEFGGFAPGSDEVLERDVVVRGPITISGRVLDAAGTPVVGVRVQAVSGCGTRLVLDQAEIGNWGRSDVEGRFLLSCFGSEPENVAISGWLGPSDGPPLFVRTCEASLESWYRDDLVQIDTIVLPRAADVQNAKVVLTDESGLPLEGIIVEARGERITFTTATNEGGEAVFSMLSSDPLFWQTRSQQRYWAVGWIDPLSSQGSRVIVDLVDNVRGVALGEGGLPIPFAAVQVQGPRGFSADSVGDEAGRFNLWAPAHGGEFLLDGRVAELNPADGGIHGDRSQLVVAGLVGQGSTADVVGEVYSVPVGYGFERSSLFIIAKPAGGGAGKRWTDWRVDGAQLEAWGITQDYGSLVVGADGRRSVTVMLRWEELEGGILDIGPIELAPCAAIGVRVTGPGAEKADGMSGVSVTAYLKGGDGEPLEGKLARNVYWLPCLPIGQAEIVVQSATGYRWSGEVNVESEQSRIIDVEIP